MEGSHGPIRTETSADKVGERFHLEEDVVIASSHANLVEGITNSKSTGLSSDARPLSVGQRLSKEKALKDVTNKLDPKPVKLKPSWAGVKSNNSLGPREVGFASKWVSHDPVAGPTDEGLKTRVELTGRGDPVHSRSPDPIISSRTDALECEASRSLAVEGASAEGRDGGTSGSSSGVDGGDGHFDGRGCGGCCSRHPQFVWMLKKSSLLCWNCRGAGGREFMCEASELVRVHRPLIFVILEPRVSDRMADESCKNLGLKRWVRSDAPGFSRGIWAC